MKHLMKRGFALLLALVMVLGLMPAMSLAVSAESSIVNYQYGYVSDTYPSVIKNWGTRGEVATFLSPNAEAFYTGAGTSLEALSALEGSSDTATVVTSNLYLALQELMANAQTKTTSYGETKTMFQFTDCQKNGAETTAISGFYSGASVGPAWDTSSWNREHTWPNSKGGDPDCSDSTRNHETDIMMLRPESASTNSSRGNKAYGTSTGFYNPNISSYNLHGDVARIVLYSYVRWGSTAITTSGNSGILSDNMWGTDGVIESLDLLIAWATEDPVDTWELARNDSVQSITGTRNVFVDYPELVFELFEKEIPAGYDSPSGSANTTGYTVTTNVVNPEYGEVTVNGEHVTVRPYTDCEIASISFSNGATYTQNGNVFTLTSAVDTTVTVTFAQTVSYTVTVMENGTAVNTVSKKDGELFVLPEFSGTLPTGYSFYGWATNDVGESSTQPSVIHAPGTEMAIDDDYTYYAVLTYTNAADDSESTMSYKLLTDASKLKAGDKCVIASATTNVAMSTTQNGNNRGQATITKNADGTLALPLGSDVAVFTLETGTADGTFAFKEESYNNGAGGYLYAASKSSNWLRTQNNIDANASFKITITDGAATVTAQGANTRNLLRYNSTSKIFACYGSGQEAVALYVGSQNTGSIYYTTTWKMDWETEIDTTAPTCEHTNTTTVTVPATCATAGSETVTCDDCGATVSETTLPALGHTWGDWVQTAAPTCTEAGTETRTCSVCGETENQAVAAAGHNYVDGACTVCGEKATQYKEVAFSELKATDTVIIVSKKGTAAYAMSNDKAASAAPTAVAVDIVDDTITTDATTILWNIAIENGNWTIYPAGTTASWLYCTAANNGVRVGTNANKAFVMDGTGYLKNTATNRYLGVYNGQDWRCYTSTTTNIADQTFSFYKFVENSSECAHVNTVEKTEIAATCTEDGYAAGIFCEDCQTYTIGGTVIPALGHTWGEWVQTAAPTCTIAGSQTRTCSVCSETEIESIAALGHSADENGVCAACGIVVTPAVGTPYNMAIAQNHASVNKTLYITSGIATSEILAEAVTVYLETVDGVEGGYRLYFMDGETKTYIRIYESTPKKAIVEATTTLPAEYLTYDSTANTLVFTGSANSFYMGTYNNLETLNVSNTSYITGSNAAKVDVTQFPVRLYPKQEVAATAQDGLDKLQETMTVLYNGMELPGTVTVGEVEMTVAWSIEASDANAAKLEGNKLILAPQAASATYTLTATVTYAADTASGSFGGTVVPTSAFPDGCYVLYTADSKALTTIDSAYGYMTSTNGVSWIDGSGLSGYVGGNLFTFTSNGDGTYSLVDNNGKYIYSDISRSSNQFNAAAEKPATGAAWTVVDNGDGTCTVYNVDRAGAIGYDAAYGSFGVYTDSAKHTALYNVLATADINAVTYIFSNYTPGTAGAQGEVHELDAAVFLTVNGGFFTSELRIYKDKNVVIQSTKDINKLIVNAGNATATLKVYGSDYGLNWTELGSVSVVSAYANNVVTIPQDTTYGYIKLVAEGAQVRLEDITLSLGDEIPACTHTNQVEGTVVPHTCTTEGYTQMVCIDCGAETEKVNYVPAAHTPVVDAAVAPTLTTTGLTEGSHCSVCNEVLVAQAEVPCLASVDSWNLTLDSDVVVNFRFVIDNSIVETAQVSIAVGTDSAVLYNASECGWVEDGYLWLPLHVAAAQMQDEIKIQILNGGEATETKTYSIRQYADTILNGEYDDATKQLVRDMLNYGAMAQVYFGHNAENLANAGITGFGTAEVTEATCNETIYDGAVDGIRFHAASLVYGSKVAVRLYFEVLSGSIEDYSFSNIMPSDGVKVEKLTPVAKDGYYYIEFADIAPNRWNEAVNLYVTKGDQSIQVQYSPLSYMVRMSKKATSGENLKNLLNAMYNYHLAAAALISAS